jgi:homoserine kinase type II
MAIYTPLAKRDAIKIADEFALGELINVTGIRNGSVNTHYLLETKRGRFFAKIDEIKGELEVKQELDLLLYLKKQGFPCLQPIKSKSGRHYVELDGKILTISRYLEGAELTAEALNATHLTALGTALANLHLIGRGYKKGIDNRFGFNRIVMTYREARRQLPAHLKHIIRVLDACRGKLIYDLATAVNALCFVDARYRIDRFEALISGYESLRPLSLPEWDSFPNELRFSALRFTVTRIKDFFLRKIDENQRVYKDFKEFYERLLILRREKSGGMEDILLAMATGYDYRKYQKSKPSK